MKLSLAKATEDKGEWVFNSEYSEYYWIGEGEPKVYEEKLYEAPNDEELKAIRQQEELLFQELRQKKNEERKEKRKQKMEEIKNAMKRPINPLPESELCDYEKLREKNIKEREDAMRESGFYEGLLTYKRHIGLL